MRICRRMYSVGNVPLLSLFLLVLFFSYSPPTEWLHLGSTERKIIIPNAFVVEQEDRRLESAGGG